MQRALNYMVDENKEVVREGKGVKGKPYRYWRPLDGPPCSTPDGDIHSGQTPSLNDRNGNLDNAETLALCLQEGSGLELDLASSLICDQEYMITQVVPALERCESVALDIETTSLNPFEGKVRLLSLYERGELYLIDCFTVDPTPVLEVLRDKTLYVHNAEFDLPFLYHAYGFSPSRSPLDTMHLSRTVRAGEGKINNNGKRVEIKHDLKDVLARELDVQLGDKKKFQSGEAWGDELTREHLEYAAADVFHLRDLFEKLHELVKDRDLEETWKLEQRAKLATLDTCFRGIPFDNELRDAKIQNLEERVKGLKAKAEEMAPEHPEGDQWNLNSNEQVKSVLHLKGKKIANVQRATLVGLDDPLATAISEYRDAKNELSKMRDWEKGRCHDGRVYPRWNPYGAATGRMTCAEPNIQSLPKEGGWRECIRPVPGRTLVKADLSQIELRVLAAYTEDEGMLGVFERGEDLHSATAEAIVGHPVEKGSPERQAAKAVNFGFSFGMGAKKFRKYAQDKYGVRMTLREATEAKNKFLAAYPGVSAYHDEVAARCERGVCEARSMLGRKRMVPYSLNGVPSFTEMVNHPIQATAADILKVALGKLHEARDEYPGAFPIITVHDEVVIECPEEEVGRVKGWLSSILQEAVESVLGVPGLASGDLAELTLMSTWGDRG